MFKPHLNNESYGKFGHLDESLRKLACKNK